MEKSNLDRKLAWICTIGYFTVWILALSKGGSWPLLAPAFVLAGLYAGGHYYEMRSRNHVALSADPTALLLVLAGTALGTVAAYLLGVTGSVIFSFLMGLPVAWFAGHAAVFALIMLLEKLKPGK